MVKRYAVNVVSGGSIPPPRASVILSGAKNLFRTTTGDPSVALLLQDDKIANFQLYTFNF